MATEADPKSAAKVSWEFLVIKTGSADAKKVYSKNINGEVVRTFEMIKNNDSFAFSYLNNI